MRQSTHNTAKLPRRLLDELGLPGKSISFLWWVCSLHVQMELLVGHAEKGQVLVLVKSTGRL